MADQINFKSSIARYTSGEAFRTKKELLPIAKKAEATSRAANGSMVVQPNRDKTWVGEKNKGIANNMSITKCIINQIRKAGGTGED